MASVSLVIRASEAPDRVNGMMSEKPREKNIIKHRTSTNILLVQEIGYYQEAKATFTIVVAANISTCVSKDHLCFAEQPNCRVGLLLLFTLNNISSQTKLTIVINFKF